MTAIPEAPPMVPRFLSDLMADFDVLKDLVGIADEFAEGTRAETRRTVPLSSEAQVDAAAARLGITAGRPCCGRYQAVYRKGPVTVTFVCTGPDAVPPAGAAAFGAVLHMASGDAPASAA